MEFINYRYLILLAFLFFSCALNRVIPNNRVILLFGFVLMCFSGFRYDAGIDYFNYERFIFSNHNLFFIEPLGRYLLLKARYYNEPWIFFFTTSATYVAGMMYALKRLNVLGNLSIFIFTTFALMYITSFGFVRQYVALSLVFVALTFLYDKKKYYFIIFVLLASLMHISAIIMLFLYPMRFLFLKNYSIVFHLSLMLIGYFSIDIILKVLSVVPYFNYYVSYMLDGRFGTSGSKIFITLLCVFLVNSFFQFLIKHKKTKLMTFSQNMFSLGLTIYSTFLTFGEAFVRLGYYLIPFMIVWTVLIYSEISLKFSKMVYLSFICFMGLSFYFSSLYFAQTSYRGDFLNNMIFIWER